LWRITPSDHYGRKKKFDRLNSTQEQIHTPCDSRAIAFLDSTQYE
jgi:hypothetical protein